MNRADVAAAFNLSITSAAGILSDARLRAGISQRELAVRAGTSPSAIANYETGKKDPSLTTLERLIEACGMELRIEAVELTLGERTQREWDGSLPLKTIVANTEQAKRARSGLVA